LMAALRSLRHPAEWKHSLHANGGREREEVVELTIRRLRPTPMRRGSRA
jgi:hypothetical protein